ncbi:hypothetical protein Q4491_02725 [Photobacterium sp. 2_MG-2023]|uniref:imm11 family protein n=1 Tax=Photobacterium sp. 2_MG-2023 TaxID=3062663 RepID=UPI0026E3AAC4|nr:DUF1629 domain-containing protein [Photobacterium sp. 2_MG-2023]MDO6580248.1 hypothetical protein [Photobacterium sp. 2_MG-2023]
MLEQADGSDEGLEHLMSLRSIKPRVFGPGVVEVLEGDSSRFTPCDYHETAEQLVSEKFRQVLQVFNLPGVDFYQTNIVSGSKTWTEHYYMHVWHHHRAINKGRSKIDGAYIDDDFILEYLSLDENFLDKIPLEERLVFRLEEDPTFLFHETVVQALREANLTGLSFERVDEWSIGSAFE